MQGFGKGRSVHRRFCQWQIFRVIVVSVSPRYCRYHGNLRLSPKGAATVTRDGEILARHPNGEQHYGQRLTGSAFEQPGESGAGTFVKIAQTDGVERLYGYYKLPEYRMTFVLGEPMATVIQPHVDHRTTFWTQHRRQPEDPSDG